MVSFGDFLGLELGLVGEVDIDDVLVLDLGCPFLRVHPVGICERLDGLSDQAWRERIGNAVPPAAAEAIANVMGTTLLMAWSGQTFFLDSMPIWVRPVAVAIALPGASA